MSQKKCREKSSCVSQVPRRASRASLLEGIAFTPNFAAAIRGFVSATGNSLVTDCSSRNTKSTFNRLGKLMIREWTNFQLDVITSCSIEPGHAYALALYLHTDRILSKHVTFISSMLVFLVKSRWTLLLVFYYLATHLRPILLPKNFSAMINLTLFLRAAI